MAKSNTVNISFRRDLLEQIDRIAKEESRSRSELIREAARNYIERKRVWKRIFAFGEKQAKKQDIKEADVSAELAAERRRKRESL